MEDNVLYKKCGLIWACSDSSSASFFSICVMYTCSIRWSIFRPISFNALAIWENSSLPRYPIRLCSSPSRNAFSTNTILFIRMEKYREMNIPAKVNTIRHSRQIRMTNMRTFAESRSMIVSGT
ncbi:hypothetical protein D1872_254390 [compost metagenome]